MFIWNLIFIIILVALNGFFVAIEFAAVASRKSRIDLLAEQDSPAIKIVKTWLENPAARDRLIAASQLGITIVSLALGSVGEKAFEALLEPYFHQIELPAAMQSLSSVLAVLPLIISLIIITSVHVVLGEQVPKVASLHNPERVALLGARPMHIFSTIFKWFVDLLDWATRQILKLLGLGIADSHSVMYTIEELKQIVAESEEGGVLETPERQMLHAVFDFGELFVRQVMIPRTEISAFEADMNLREAIDIAIHSSFTKFPVYDDDLDNIIGVVHIKDLLRAEQDPERYNCQVRTLAREALFIPETVPVKSVLKEFRDRRQHIAIVMDEFSGTAGLVTLEDLMEEIVGEVSDPFDTQLPEIHHLPNGFVIVDGLALIDDVNEALNTQFEDPNYDTIAGYFLGVYGRIPGVGDEIVVDGVQLRVEKMDAMRIESLQLARIEPPPIEPPTTEEEA
jgi:CBS domain containing-hemolysin-like protein